MQAERTDAIGKLPYRLLCEKARDVKENSVEDKIWGRIFLLLRSLVPAMLWNRLDNIKPQTIVSSSLLASV